MRPLLPIPISTAGWIATEFGYDQVVIYGRRVGAPPDPRGEHVTTFGFAMQDKPIAARIGDLFVERVAGWENDGELTLSEAICSVAAERQRQIDVEGWALEHDDKYERGELALAAALYALPYEACVGGEPLIQRMDATRLHMTLEIVCGWELKFEPDRRRRFVKAAALLLAEIERLDRLSLKANAGSGISPPEPAS